jgi:hypothetical protein
MTFEWYFELMTVREGNAQCVVLCSVVGAVTVREIWLTCLKWFLATATHAARSCRAAGGWRGVV